jgi:hypothetical protein
MAEIGSRKQALNVGVGRSRREAAGEEAPHAPSFRSRRVKVCSCHEPPFDRSDAPSPLRAQCRRSGLITRLPKLNVAQVSGELRQSHYQD